QHDNVGGAAEVDVGGVDLVAGRPAHHQPLGAEAVAVDAAEQETEIGPAARFAPGEGQGAAEAHECYADAGERELAAAPVAPEATGLAAEGEMHLAERPVPGAPGLCRAAPQFHEIAAEGDGSGKAVAAEIGEAPASPDIGAIGSLHRR